VNDEKILRIFQRVVRLFAEERNEKNERTRDTKKLKQNEGTYGPS
jgi:hypothetical protein